MATFTNQATLSYNNTVTNSNTVTGELLETLSATKTSSASTYSPGDTVPYIISIVNAGAVPYTNLTVTDDLGAFTEGTTGTLLYPLTYTDGSLRYYQNGVLQPAPTVAPGPPLVISGVDVPANGNVTLIYEGEVNTFAPLAQGSVIANEAVISGTGLNAPLRAAEEITADNSANLTISKSVCPDTVVENGQLSYTFVLQNTGSAEADAASNVSISDTFSPILNPITVTLNGSPLPADAYTYDTATGEFRTTPGSITVPAASYTRDPATGSVVTTPGVTVLRVTGTV